MQQPMICFAITKNNRNSIILSQMFKKNPKPVGDGDEITESFASWKWFRQTPGGKTQSKKSKSWTLIHVYQNTSQNKDT